MTDFLAFFEDSNRLIIHGNPEPRYISLRYQITAVRPGTYGMLPAQAKGRFDGKTWHRTGWRSLTVLASGQENPQKWRKSLVLPI